jgi:hypothetical protein
VGRAVSNWGPIETAPKDGTIVLGCSGTGDECQVYEWPGSRTWNSSGPICTASTVRHTECRDATVFCGQAFLVARSNFTATSSGLGSAPLPGLFACQSDPGLPGQQGRADPQLRDQPWARRPDSWPRPFARRGSAYIGIV